MRWYRDYKPYVSVGQRRAQAKREVEKRAKKGQSTSPVVLKGTKIATTFWGKAWCTNLESYSDYSNRLPRGRTYVRNGSVVDLQIAPSKITALVSGSNLYTVNITIAALADDLWASVKSRCAGEIGTLVELLQGKFSRSVMDIVTQRDGGLFPKPSEIKLSCSCPDWAGMCKHVAATMYGVGARLDEQPELLFLLRKVDHLDLLQTADLASGVGAATKRGTRTLATSDLSDVFGIELTGAAETGAVETGDAASPAIEPVVKPKRRKAGAAQPTPSAQNGVPPAIADAKPRARSSKAASVSKAAGAPKAARAPKPRKATLKTAPLPEPAPVASKRAAKPVKAAKRSKPG